MLQNVLPSILLSVFSSLLPLIVYKSDSAVIPHWTKLAASFSLDLALCDYCVTSILVVFMDAELAVLSCNVLKISA